MGQFGVQSAEIICRYVFSFFTIIDFGKSLDDRGCIFYHPKAIIITIKGTFCMKILNLVENLFVYELCNFAQGFCATCT